MSTERIAGLAETVVPRFENKAFIPPSARLSQLALAALENGVDVDDVHAYLSARYSYQLVTIEQVSL